MTPGTLLPGVHFDHRDQCYKVEVGLDVDELVANMDVPLSATYQLTRDCILRCTYCSEPPGIQTTSLDEHKAKIDKLAGMRRIILSGGEPMDYPFFWEVLEYVQGKFELVVLSTNATRIKRAEAVRLKDMVDYVDVTVDGPRRQHNRIRGQYDDVLEGLMHPAARQDPAFCYLRLYARRKARHRQSLEAAEAGQQGRHALHLSARGYARRKEG